MFMKRQMVVNSCGFKYLLFDRERSSITIRYKCSHPPTLTAQANIK